MADAKTRAQNILRALPLTNKQRELYERGAAAMDEATLERMTSKLESALSRAPETLAAARELLGIEQAQSGKCAVDIGEILSGTIVQLRNEALLQSVTIRTELAAGLPKVLADRVQLQQILMNLMVNAIEAMKNRGGELTIRSQAEDRALLISISDTGAGLPTENTDQIFAPFFTTKPQGTGMGLAIARSIVEAHGGQLWASANADRGATFHFTLPIAAYAGEAPATSG